MYMSDRCVFSFILSTPFESLFLTRREWEEKGSEYLKEHGCSNAYLPPVPDEPPDVAKRRKRQQA